MNTSTVAAPKQQQQQPKRPLTIRETLGGQAFRDAVAQALPRHLTPDRFLRVATTAITETPKLAECDPASFFARLLTLSQLGIEPDGRRAHLIPFWNSKRSTYEVQLIVDYKGLAELAMRSGLISSLHADVVRDQDEFEYNCGQVKRHRIDFRKPRGNIYAAYALARFKDGDEKAEAMSVDEIEEVRKRSKAAKAGPWVTDWAEMAKKTVFRRLSKMLPLSPEFRDAVEADEAAEERAGGPGAPANLVSVDAFALPEPGGDASGQPPETDDAATASELDPTAGAQGAVDAIPSRTPQQQLASVVVGAGHSFERFRAWAHENKQLPAASSVGSFDELPSELCVRMIRASVGLLRALDAAAKEGR